MSAADEVLEFACQSVLARIRADRAAAAVTVLVDVPPRWRMICSVCGLLATGPRAPIRHLGLDHLRVYPDHDLTSEPA